MMRTYIFIISALVVLFSLPSFAKDRVPAGFSLSKNSFVKVSFGYHQMDEFHFQKKNAKVWWATWVDRDMAKADRKLRRALPTEIMQGELDELEKKLLRLNPVLAVQADMPCASKFILEAGDAPQSPSNKTKMFCLDGLNLSESDAFGIWIASMMQLF